MADFSQLIQIEKRGTQVLSLGKATWWLLLGGAVALRLYILAAPPGGWLAQGIADDSFYYLTIARHVANGSGFTFDGLLPTNGFHPLFALLLIPLFWLFPEGGLPPVYASQVLVLTLNLVAAVPLYYLLKLVGGPTSGRAGVLVWLYNPWGLIFTVSGVESAVYTLCIVLALYAYAHWRLHPGLREIKAPVLIGILLGATVLARSDGVFLGLVLGLDLLLFNSWREPGLRKHFGWDLFRPAILLLLGAAAVIAPWLLWNWFTFGSLVQVSGQAVYWHTHATAVTAGDSAAWITSALISLVRTVVGGMYFSAGAFVILVLAVAMRLMPMKSRIPVPQPGKRLLTVCGLYGMLLLTFYGVYLWQQQFWYFMPVLLVSAVFGGVLWAWICEVFTEAGKPVVPRIAELGLVLVVLLTFVPVWRSWQSGRLQVYPAQAGAFHLAERLAQETPPDAVIGAWNSGILGYFSGRTVINLDGVVNNELHREIRSQGSAYFDLCAIWNYVQKRNIQYLTDYENVFHENTDVIFNGSLLRVLELEEYSPGSVPVRIYQVLDPGKQPSIPSCPGPYKQ